MRYSIEGDDLCIRISLDAIAANVSTQTAGWSLPLRVVDKAALALSVGRELCECVDAGEDFYLNHTLDAALERVIEGADPSLDFVSPSPAPKDGGAET